MADDLTFGPWLQRRRQALFLTQQQLGQLVSCSKETIRKLEADQRRPSADVARLLATALLIPSEEFPAFLRFARGERAETPGGPSAAAPSRSRPIQSPSNVPVPSTSLIGREAEVATVRALLLGDDVRLLTLTGPGGVGKTRLSYAAAAALRAAFVDGTIFVNLAPIRDPELVLSTVAEALEIKDVGRQPLLASVQSHLRHRQLLLVLDNFEQVLAAGPVVANLLGAAPRLRVLATSRERLHLRGERELAVAPLALPPAGVRDLSTLTRYDAVRLFIQRAQAGKADFQVTNATAPAIAEICARLDGLPLAIELAAARTRLLPPKALLERLSRTGPGSLQLLTGGPNDLPLRQQTLRATIDWSYHLLERGEQTLFARLAIFSGGWTLEAAEQVCNSAGELPFDLLDGMESLIGKSLIYQVDGAGAEPRWTMFETVRGYALEQLELSGELLRLQEAHAAYVLAFVERADRALRTHAQEAWLERIEQDQDNIRAVLVRSEGAALLRLVGGLWWFWLLRSSLDEWRRAAARCWASSGGEAAARGKVLLGEAFFAQLLVNDEMDVARVAESATESLRLFRAAGDEWGITAASLLVAQVELNQGTTAAGLSRLEDSVALARHLDDAWLLSSALQMLGTNIRLHVDVERAAVLLEEGVVRAHQAGDRWILASALAAYGWVLAARSRYQEARAVFEEAYSCRIRLKDRLGMGRSCFELGEVAIAIGDYAAARALTETRLAIDRETGNDKGAGHALLWLGRLSLAANDFEQALAALDESLAIRRAIGDDWNCAWTVIWRGRVMFAQAAYEPALKSFEEGLDLFQAGGHADGVTWALTHVVAVRLAREDPDIAALLRAHNRALWLEPQDTLGVAKAVEALANVLAHTDRAVQAVRLLAAAETFRDARCNPRTALARIVYEEAIDRTRAVLGDADWASAWAEGRIGRLDECIADAIEEPYYASRPQTR